MRQRTTTSGAPVWTDARLSAHMERYRLKYWSRSRRGRRFVINAAPLDCYGEMDTDPRVQTIVYDVGSPGGNAAGATEFAKEVLAGRAKNRIIAVANHTMASAAYWAMPGATEIVASPSALVGSIACIRSTTTSTTRWQSSASNARLSPRAATTAKASMVDRCPRPPPRNVESLVNSTYGRFVASVAAGRGTTTSLVRKGYPIGDGPGAAAPLVVIAASPEQRIVVHTHTSARNRARRFSPRRCDR
jgi:hypothetical protein